MVPDAISIGFALYGVAGFLGNIAATQVVGRLGTFRTSLLSTGAVGIGIAIWAAGAGLYLLMAAGLFIWGLGFAAANSMQQARLVAASPAHRPITALRLVQQGVHGGRGRVDRPLPVCYGQGNISSLLRHHPRRCIQSVFRC